MNESKIIFYPVFAQVLLTYGVGVHLAVARSRAFRNAKKFHPQQLADSQKWDEILKDAENPSDAFENLFEVPVLFFAAVLALYVTGKSDSFYVAMAWIFVLCRAVQAWVHCTSNVIMVRAMAFWLGSVVLFAIWARLAIQIIGQ
jgi:hypothetical protein